MAVRRECSYALCKGRTQKSNRSCGTTHTHHEGPGSQCLLQIEFHFRKMGYCVMDIEFCKMKSSGVDSGDGCATTWM